MSKRKVVSGKDLLIIFEHFGFSVLRQKGSHSVLRRFQNGEKQTLTIPNHATIDRGTSSAIYRQALRYIKESELRSYFFVE